MRADDRRLGLLAVILFFAARIPLLYLRQPFFDELFTSWISAKSFAGILEALRYDSGPPLYYFIVHVVGHPRGLSLLFATIGFIALLRARGYGAALLLAVFPPAVLFAVDARSYALCAMFVTLGVLALERDRPYRAALAFVAAAYSHYYGVLFFPLVRRVRPALLLALFLPGLWLALHQPREAMNWMQHFAYPDALFARPPVALIVLIALLCVWAGFSRPDRLKPVHTQKHLLNFVLPYVLSLPIYVPLRFESVVATPLLLWLTSTKRVILFGLAACFATWTLIGIVDHAHRPIDDYRDAAMHLSDAKEPVVASGYLYLETALLRPVTAFPQEQAQHPGWRAVAAAGSELPKGTFLWIGERNAPELSIIRQTRSVQPLYVNARAMIARVR